MHEKIQTIYSANKRMYTLTYENIQHVAIIVYAESSSSKNIVISERNYNSNSKEF